MINKLIWKIRNFRRTRRRKVEDLAAEFFEHIGDLLVDERVLCLDQYTQHCGYTRLTHSLDVAFYSFRLARLFGWDTRSTARGGLLHDLFYYDWRTNTEKFEEGPNHAVAHPKIALKNARKICNLNKIEEDIIVKHMWLITFWPPRYKESFIVTFVDKYCALKEFIASAVFRREGQRFFALKPTCA